MLVSYGQSQCTPSIPWPTWKETTVQDGGLEPWPGLGPGFSFWPCHCPFEPCKLDTESSSAGGEDGSRALPSTELLLEATCAEAPR